jgi:U3 small nucleolar RNA-associated protein 24
MGRKKPIKKFAQVKKIINPSDPRLKSVQQQEKKRKDEAENSKVRELTPVASSLFFRHNRALIPPYQVLVDTNFINFSIKNKLDLIQAMMDCLYAEAVPCVTDCVIAELEKLGTAYRVALRVARDPRFERLPCIHRGTYADDCLVQRVTQHRCYIVATCDKGLKQRLRKIPGVPIMYISGHKYNIEQLPEAYGVMF